MVSAQIENFKIMSKIEKIINLNKKFVNRKIVLPAILIMECNLVTIMKDKLKSRWWESAFFIFVLFCQQNQKLFWVTAFPG